MHDNDVFLYIQSLRTRHWLGMLAAVDAELMSHARLPSGKGDVDFMRFLVATRVYLLGEGKQRPPVMEDQQFLSLKPLCESLVAQGRFGTECLDLFSGVNAWPAFNPSQGAVEIKRP